MNIQPLTPNDLHAIPGLQPTGWPDIGPTHAFYTTSDFCFPLKVIIDERIAGIGTAIVHNDVAWLGHIIVHPDFRKRGLGGEITQALVDTGLSRKCRTLYLIATDMGEPVYKKIGFEVETHYLFFKDLTRKAHERSQNIVSYTGEFREQVASLDKFVSGEDRMFHLDEHLSGGYLHLNENKVDGFYLPTFGEGLIEATSAAGGLDLMKLRLSEKDTAAFPVDNKVAVDFMYQNNLREFKRASRMRLGEKREYKPELIYNRIAGNIG